MKHSSRKDEGLPLQLQLSFPTFHPLFLRCTGTYFPGAGAGLSVLAVPDEDTGLPPSAGLESLPCGPLKPSKNLGVGLSAGEPSRPNPSRAPLGRHFAAGCAPDLSSRGAGDGAASLRPRGAASPGRRAGGTYPPVFFGNWTSSVAISVGGAAG